jgi:hypothetical protein
MCLGRCLLRLSPSETDSITCDSPGWKYAYQDREPGKIEMHSAIILQVRDVHKARRMFGVQGRRPGGALGVPPKSFSPSRSSKEREGAGGG